MLARNVKANWVPTFAKQIQKRSSPPDYTFRARTAVRYIRRLANLDDDGRLKAMELLLEAADDYCSENGMFNFKRLPEDYHDGGEELIPMEKLMCDLIREQYTASQRSKTDWVPEELMEKMNEVRSERYACEVDFGECDPTDREHLFDESLSLLEIVWSRRVATVLATRAVGHLLPPELVDMVRDCICSDVELRVVSGAKSDDGY